MNPDVVIETFSGSSAVAQLHSFPSAIRAVGGRRLDRLVEKKMITENQRVGPALLRAADTTRAPSARQSLGAFVRRRDNIIED